ncbi:MULTISPECIES: stage II sporulation protein M [Microbulbifer]|uniref:stage II sporulation protein M n=1 Tax=Microbulbifer TaxID=48073 RepID=UPI001E3C8720|nr:MULTISPECIES: stage II sporulation protein M [Microbulbifer]UHQ53783.1 stage II sporulation protein M [Microbulbifer sp. YPW16]
MRQREFEKRHESGWRELEAALRTDGGTVADLPGRYRQLCQQFAMASERHYTSDLQERLNRLVMAAHQRIYRRRPLRRSAWVDYLLGGFPRAVRSQARAVYLSTALFLLPALVLGIGCYLNDSLVYTLMEPEQVSLFESMYDPANRVTGRERGSDSDLYMFGFYIKNNIGIAFRTFAAGIIFGVGAVFILVFNGVYIGATAGHLTRLGFGGTFYPFVIGHGAFELTAIALAGAAGLCLGQSLIDPGGYPRLVALRKAASRAMQIMYGTFLMLVLAAFLEAFWSSSQSLPVGLKLATGAALWILVLAYLAFAGRGGQHRAT